MAEANLQTLQVGTVVLYKQGKYKIVGFLEGARVKIKPSGCNCGSKVVSIYDIKTV